MKGMCKKCGKKKDCKKLCKEAEEYANQDFVPTEEGLVGINLENYDRYDYLGHDKWNTPNLNNSATLKEIIVLLYLDGKSQRGIAELVPCSRRYIRQIIGEYKNEISKCEK